MAVGVDLVRRRGWVLVGGCGVVAVAAYFGFRARPEAVTGADSCGDGAAAVAGVKGRRVRAVGGGSCGADGGVAVPGICPLRSGVLRLRLIRC